jgi:superfamily II DNA or RNA helicase
MLDRVTAITSDSRGIAAGMRRNCANGDDQPSHLPQCEGAPGSLVMARDLRWRVRDRRTFETCALVALAAVHGNRQRAITLVSPPDVITACDERVAWRRRSLPWGCTALARALRAVFGAAELPAAPLSIVPWQFAAARAFLEGRATRVLLADEVGLGKTIQATLAVGALHAVARADRVLVLAPSGLRDQWRDELARLFGLSGAVADARELRARRGSLPAHVSPWLRQGITIASLDFVKQPEILVSCAAVPWDLVIIDEAHALAPGTDRLGAAETICRAARRVLLLTGTPHSGDEDAFATMCRVGAVAGDATPLLVIRRTADEVGYARQRRVRWLRVRDVPAEARAHALLERYVRRVWTSAPPDAGQGRLLAMAVLLKRAASSMAALARSLAHRIRCLDDGALVPGQGLLSFDEDGELDQRDGALPATLAAPGLLDRPTELRLLHELVGAVLDAIAGDPKLQLLTRFLRRVREPVLVFTEYRDTLDVVLERLAPGARVAVLHGAMSRRERNDNLRSFTDGRRRVLVATDVAAEGLNLHGHCRTVLNMELPWTPTRLEQRVGRIDRLGQSRSVHVLHLLRPHGVEPWLARRLAARAARADRSLRSADYARDLDDISTATAALRLEPLSLAYGHVETRTLVVDGAQGSDFDAPDSGLTTQDAGDVQGPRDPADGTIPSPIRIRGHGRGLDPDEIARVRSGDSLLRAILSRAPMVAASGSGLSVVRLSRTKAVRLQLPRGITIIVRFGLALGGSMPVSRYTAIAFRLDWSRAPDSLAAVLEQVMALVHREIGQLSAARDEAADDVLRFAATSLARERALMAAVAHAEDTANPMQPGLFDRRADRLRAAASAAGRQRRLLHGSYASAIEADREAGPELAVDPLLAFVVR